ncbi:MAG: hypothetical protein CM1200mP14_13350 [Gammaproteobacteria bacterium]|nr:MAG: hypothetical protein CM1200mP14_13350 [Gammaproteobacteria bacterium]
MISLKNGQTFLIQSAYSSIKYDGVWVISARLNRILKYSSAGELQYYLGAYGGTRGGFAGGGFRVHTNLM